NKFTLPLVGWFGGSDAVLGWQCTMALYGAIACLLFWTTFASTRERIAPDPAQRSSPWRDLADLARNPPWLILFALALIIMLTITLRAGSAYYYFTYYLGRPELLSDYLFVQMIAYAAGALLAPVLVRHIDKSRLLVLLMGLVAGLSLLMAFVPPQMIWAIFTLNALISLCLGPKSPLTWSMYADTADYNEWRHGRRATAMTFSAATFAQKLGGSLGSAGMLWLLALLGYAANQAQADASKLGINLLQTAIPAAFALLAAAVALGYRLRGEQLAQIQAELVQRQPGAA
ncbi:MAG: MFS transporter, partial [Xanthomonadales bacterium]|nr:MFS transporter [Xanthomonadales bacterium]